MRLPTPHELPRFSRTVYLAAADILCNHWHEVLTHHLIQLVGCDERQLAGAVAKLNNAGLVARPEEWESSSVVRVRGLHAAGGLVWPVFGKMLPAERVLTLLLWWEACSHEPPNWETLGREANLTYGEVSGACRELEGRGLSSTIDTRLGDVTGMYVSLTDFGKVAAAELVARFAPRE